MRLYTAFLTALSLTIGLTCLFGNSATAFACSCAEATSAEYFDNATAVFVGTVKSISEDRGKKSVNFQVTEVQKGSITESVTVTTGWGDADCGFTFAEGATYIVYAYGEDEFSTSICSGTSQLTVNSPEPNTNPEMPTTKSDGEGNSVITLFLVALTSFGAGMLLVYTIRKK